MLGMNTVPLYTYDGASYTNVYMHNVLIRIIITIIVRSFQINDFICNCIHVARFIRLQSDYDLYTDCVNKVTDKTIRVPR